MRILKAIVLSLLPLAMWAVLLDPVAADEPDGRLRKEPNVILDVSPALVGAVVRRQVDRTAPVDEIIQETPVHGMGRTIATIGAELIPDARRAAIDVVLQGNVWSRTVGTRRTILIHTSTTTSLDVRRRVLLDETGIRLFAGPAHAEATTRLLDISSTMDFDALSIKVAHRLYQNSEAAAEAETAVKTAAHAANALHDELATTLTSLNQSVRREFMGFKRVGLAVEGMGFHSTAANLQGRLRFTTGGRIEPKSIPFLPADIDLGVRIHESVANEAAQTEFSGRVFTLGGVSKLYDDVTRGLIRDDRKDAEQRAGLKSLEKAFADLAGKPVMITLTEKDPVTVAFAGDGFSVEVRIASVRQEKLAYAGLRGKAIYAFVNSKGGVHALRKGPVQIVAAPAQPDKQLAALPAHILMSLELLAGEVMTERVALNALPLPEALANLRLQPPQAFGRDGWFTLAWKLGKLTE